MKLTDIDVSAVDTLFLDRDGVINKLRPGDYVKNWDEFEFLPDVFNALALWNETITNIIIVTNQRGIGRGLMTEQDLEDIHRRMSAEIEVTEAELIRYIIVRQLTKMILIENPISAWLCKQNKIFQISILTSR